MNNIPAHKHNQARFQLIRAVQKYGAAQEEGGGRPISLETVVRELEKKDGGDLPSSARRAR